MGLDRGASAAGTMAAGGARRSLDTAWGRLTTRRPASRAEAAGLAAAVVALVLVILLSGPIDAPWPTGSEAFCYWLPTLAAPYARSDWTEPIAYVYSPAFLQVLAPLKALPWLAFLGAWTVLLLLAVRLLSGPRLFALAIAFAAFELAGGNIHLVLAAAIVLGFRWPAAWAIVLLTKVTPGIGLLWFAFRGEWRSLWIALGATGAIVLVSFAIAPAAWADWVDVLLASTTKTSGTWASIGAPLWMRLPLAVVVVAWGARTDRAWTVPVAAMLALPALWFGSLSMLLAVIPLRGRAAPVGGNGPGSSWRMPTLARRTGLRWAAGPGSGS